MLIQCTKKLLEQLKIESAASIEEEPLFSFHANLITINRRKAVVLVNDRNRYIIVLYGLKAKDFKKLDQLIVQAIRETFRKECIKAEVIDEFINHSKDIVYTKTKDRTSVARMNKSCETVYFNEDLLDETAICQSSLGVKASRYFVGNGKNDYIHPQEELLKDLEAFFGEQVIGCRAAVLRVTLDLDAYPVWRRIVIPVNITFPQFHQVLQAAFGWQDSHLHEFYIYEDEGCDSIYSSERYINHPAYTRENLRPIVNLVCSEDALEYPNQIEMKLERNIKLSEYLSEQGKIKYNYDFGDNWQHYIEVEKLIEDYDKDYPVCLEGEGNTPPEDVGGEAGYQEFLRIISDQEDPEYEGMMNWGKSQGYKEFDVQAVNRLLKTSLGRY